MKSWKMFYSNEISQSDGNWVDYEIFHLDSLCPTTTESLTLSRCTADSNTVSAKCLKISFDSLWISIHHSQNEHHWYQKYELKGKVGESHSDTWWVV